MTAFFPPQGRSHHEAEGRPVLQARLAAGRVWNGGVQAHLFRHGYAINLPELWRPAGCLTLIIATLTPPRSTYGSRTRKSSAKLPRFSSGSRASDPWRNGGWSAAGDRHASRPHGGDSSVSLPS